MDKHLHEIMAYEYAQLGRGELLFDGGPRGSVESVPNGIAVSQGQHVEKRMGGNTAPSIVSEAGPKPA
jgi:hypothetical protein